jgi:hypothetical protein
MTTPGSCNGAAGPESCDPADYANPAVEIGALPNLAPSIVTSLTAHHPSANTPTAAALQGALNHAKVWAQTHSGHLVVVVLATDGVPSECTPSDAAGLSQIAATALMGTPSIKTFGIGVFSPADVPAGPTLLDAIAAAGGTTKAVNINTSQNVGQEFLMALNSIRGMQLGCQYSIPVPEAGTPDYGLVNVQYTPKGGMPVIIPQYPNKSGCPTTGDGWYYDNPAAPTQIFLCDSSCSTIGADATGSIEVLLGCKTEIGMVN